MQMTPRDAELQMMYLEVQRLESEIATCDTRVRVATFNRQFYVSELECTRRLIQAKLDAQMGR